MITRELVRAGLNQHVIELIDTRGGVMGRIKHQKWCAEEEEIRFFIDSEIAEESTVHDYITEVPFGQIVNDIFTSFENMRKIPDNEQKYGTCHYYLTEHVVL